MAVTAIAALGAGLLGSAPTSAVIQSHTLYIGALSSATTQTHTSTIAVGETATAVLRHIFTTTRPVGESVVVTATRVTPGTGTLKLQLTDSSTGRSALADPTYYEDGAPNDTDNMMEPQGDGVGLIGTTNVNFTQYVVSDTAASATATSLATTLNLLFQAPSVAGTYTFNVGTSTFLGSAATDGISGPSVSWTVTVTAADVTATSASTSVLRSGTKLPADGTALTDSSVTAARSSLAARTPAATIWVTQNNAAATASESMTVVVSGPALVTTDTSAAPVSGTAITVRNGGATTLNPSSYNYGANVTPIAVYSNGTAGKATITITTLSGLLIGTETVTFTGSVTGIAIEDTYRKILRAGGGTTGADQSTIGIRATDANGNGVGSLTFSMVSSAVNIVSSITTGACTADATDPGYYDCVASTTTGSVSGDKATLTYRVVNPAVTTATEYFTVEHAVTLGGSVSTWTLTSDKANYSPGEAMILTATAVDASGNPASDGSAGPTFLGSNKSLGGTALSSVFNTVYDGKSTSQLRSSTDVRTMRTDNTLYAPAASGSFTIMGTYGTGNAKTASITLTVGDDAATTAANAATDAANLAAEAADAATVAAEEARDAADAATAAVEALATEVATLMAALKAQITTLANTVAKIAKKVKA